MRSRAIMVLGVISLFWCFVLIWAVSRRGYSADSSSTWQGQLIQGESKNPVRKLPKPANEPKSWAKFIGLSKADVRAVDGSRLKEKHRTSASKQMGKGSGKPRVLMFTWATEDTYERFESSYYWKACYAAKHGYELIVTDEMDNAWDDFDKKTETDGGWYRESRMYAWHKAITKHMVSGEYDLIWMTGADTLMVPRHFDVQLTDYYDGYPLTIMDQEFDIWGFNQNALLMEAQAPGSWIEAFRAIHFTGSKEHIVQSDNGMYMITILEMLGAEAKLRGEKGYAQKCNKLAILDMPAPVLDNTDFEEYKRRNIALGECFFAELERLAGPYNSRRSSYINLVPQSDPLPWLNCWGAPATAILNGQSGVWLSISMDPSRKTTRSVLSSGMLLVMCPALTGTRTRSISATVKCEYRACVPYANHERLTMLPSRLCFRCSGAGVPVR
ncbi:uncharacterized protein AMSG_03536 [Thecamonas trahens ATCC 50062]|uniref:Nucleotide-diphospho-sugar transferase domain-containing protein n=1 Tax=Thecamonas trahens ATCC 50062 TaxID=461836 RepID=A0A0L0D433_THETB|nr:hypothetical protein AMSG_03536 [Thecamonas trahens ATCC 50062]KNC47107.1 hypothetical protein AMSG_03536 [Thecamonas trahens ATCC 50062]|eukprot:XP_013759884.1 hypothetical protein AMSG_03536 [Thecamonas trahens ATCC 50062]